MQYKGQLVGNRRTGECVVTPSPAGGWLIYDVTPSNLPEGSYTLTFGDKNEKNPSGINKRGQARFERHVWKVEDVKDA
jgi:hypothetical protein